MASLFHPWARHVAVVANYPPRTTLHMPATPVRVRRLVYVGGINRERGLGLLLEALGSLAQRHPEVHCDLVGEVDTSGIDQRMWRQRVASGVLRPHGRVPHGAVTEYLGPDAIGVIPWLPLANNTLGTPTKLFEYMAAGLPVVAPDYGFIADIVRKTGCGLLYRPGSAASLAEVAGSLVEDCRRAHDLGIRGVTAVSEEYSWEPQFMRLAELYTQILGLEAGTSQLCAE